MKLQELAVLPQTKQVAKVFESYFGKSITFESLSKRQAHAMLGRVRGLLSEHRRTPKFHVSEQNSAYLKLVMLEQVLTKKIKEEIPTATLGQPDPAKTKQALSKISDPKLKTAMTKSAAGQTLSPDEQKMVQGAALSAAMTAETRGRKGRRLSESEVQQAQVILASQDMVDQVQRMIEQVTSIQFKDLPALVDQIRNEIGYDQATKFNADSTAALGGMVQNLQQSKIQLETAMGTVTGQAPVVPGETAPDVGAEMPPVDAGAEMPAEPGAELDALAADAEADLEEPAAAGLGRERR
jgi:fructose-specific phosphotransferase system component IIB